MNVGRRFADTVDNPARLERRETIAGMPRGSTSGDPPRPRSPLGSTSGDPPRPAPPRLRSPLLLLDGASMWFRSYFGVPSSITAPDGRPVNAVRGFVDSLATLITRHRPGR